MIESWEADYSKKYPQLYDHPEEVFNQKIAAEGSKHRGVNELTLAKKRKEVD